MAYTPYAVFLMCFSLLGDVTTAHRSYVVFKEDSSAETSDSKLFRPRNSRNGRSSSAGGRSSSAGGAKPKFKAHSGVSIYKTKFAKKRRMELHEMAIRQLQRGQVRKPKGPQFIWIWYEFPPLEGYGRDRDTPSKAVLRNLDDAMKYLEEKDLRLNMIETFQAASDAMANIHGAYKPYNVFDAAFGRRKPQGVYRRGPRGSFLVRAAATLMAAAAYYKSDYQVHHAAIELLSFFTGDCSYSDAGSGSSRDRIGKWNYEWATKKPLSVPLVGCDLAILKIIQVDQEVCKDTSQEDFNHRESQEEASAYDEGGDYLQEGGDSGAAYDYH